MSGRYIQLTLDERFIPCESFGTYFMMGLFSCYPDVVLMNNGIILKALYPIQLRNEYNKR